MRAARETRSLWMDQTDIYLDMVCNIIAIKKKAKSQRQSATIYITYPSLSFRLLSFDLSRIE